MVVVGADSGEGTDFQFGVLLGVTFAGEQGSQPAAEEAERDGDDAGVLEREPLPESIFGNMEVAAPETTGPARRRPVPRRRSGRRRWRRPRRWC